MSAAEKMEQFKFRERPSIIRKAQRIADKRGENFSEILREAVRSYVRKHARELEDED